MQFFLSVIDSATGSATADEMTHIDAFNDELRSHGNWVFAAALASPEASTIVDGREDVPLFTDGPFVESKEYIAGFWIIEVPDADAARTLAAQASRACNRRVELRPFL